MDKSLHKEELLKLFSSSAYLTINKLLLKKYGPEIAVYLGNLVDKYLYFKEKNMLKDNEWFFLTHEQQIDQTGISEKGIRRNKKFLINKEVIETKMEGMPAKEWYRLDKENIFKLLEDDTPPKKRRARPSRQGMSSGAQSGRSWHAQSGRAIKDNKYKDNKYKDTKLYEDEEASSSPEKNGKHITPSGFEEFWINYPRKAQKGKALTAWEKICNKKVKERPTRREILNAIHYQKKSEQWQEGKEFIPFPSTWLNQRRWFDDPDEMKVYKDNKNKLAHTDEIKRNPGW